MRIKTSENYRGGGIPRRSKLPEDLRGMSGERVAGVTENQRLL